MNNWTLGVLKAVAELRPLRRMIFNILYKQYVGLSLLIFYWNILKSNLFISLSHVSKLSWMRAGYSHKTASPLADMLAFRKVLPAPLLSLKIKHIKKKSLLYLYESISPLKKWGRVTIYLESWFFKMFTCEDLYEWLF